MQIGVISFQNNLFSASQIMMFSELVKTFNLDDCQVVGLATCLRHEFYFSDENLETKKDQIVQEIKRKLNLERLCYKVLYQRDCFEHLSKLMAGLESPILGETHILNQVKKAYQTAQNSKKLSREIHYLYQKSLKIAKFFRYNHAEILNKESLEKKVLEQVSNMIKIDEPILLVGNSDLNRNILNQLIINGYQKVYMVSKMEPFALNKKLAGSLSYEEIDKWGSFAAVVIATSLKNAQLASSKCSAKTRLMIDLSIPCVTDFIKLSDDACYYELNDLMQMVQEKQIHLEDWKVEQEAMISSQVERQMILFYLRELKKGQLLKR